MWILDRLEIALPRANLMFGSIAEDGSLVKYTRTRPRRCSPVSDTQSRPGSVPAASGRRTTTVMRIRHTPRIVSVALVALCVLDLAVLPAQGLTHEEKVAAATRLLEMYDADKVRTQPLYTCLDTLQLAPDSRVNTQSGALTMEELGRLAGDKTGVRFIVRALAYYLSACAFS